MNHDRRGRQTCSDHYTWAPDFCFGIWKFWRKQQCTLPNPLKQKQADQRVPLHLSLMHPFCYTESGAPPNCPILLPFQTHLLRMKFPRQPTIRDIIPMSKQPFPFKLEMHIPCLFYGACLIWLDIKSNSSDFNFKKKNYQFFLKILKSVPLNYF